MATASEQGPLGPRAAQRGRPRDVSRDEALRQAALEVMAEVGYRALTMDAVATRAKAGKATIYRRWESKLDLVIDTTNHLASQRLPEPDTGSVAGDLTEFLTGFARFLTGPVGKAAQALVGELPHEPELAEAFRATFLAQQDAVLERILDRGRRRGEVRPDAPVRMVVEVAGGALVRRLMLTGQPLDETFVNGLVRGVLLPLLT
ncbi:TetR/AcrR family transcriptional regulator [Streptoalloteichus hindustanus]|uniref:Transcriptional regulator, TetR family n=1 Tax=Streptoalloteichus hindustanus TaxID=2017 RepID=A0A1M5Q1T3_STRHI|nr:TetR/AcrR family transcriptional regulator [Streptoalloteichus hindustanus]SHH07890.1 transcriptional regulator, TetR family [Streptoalloteichus hindustanus]